MVRFLVGMNDWVNRFLLGIAGAAAVALMLLAAANVVLRLLARPFVGTYEVVGFLGAVVVAFALGHTQVRKDHVLVDLVTRLYPRWLTVAVDAVSGVVTMVFFGCVGWRMVRWGMLIRRSGEVSETLKIVFDPFVYCVALGFAMLAVALLLDCVLLFAPLRKESA